MALVRNLANFLLLRALIIGKREVGLSIHEDYSRWSQNEENTRRCKPGLEAPRSVKVVLLVFPLCGIDFQLLG
jgi:hypothetical protein